jgi:hypothetical protein
MLSRRPVRPSGTLSVSPDAGFVATGVLVDGAAFLAGKPAAGAAAGATGAPCCRTVLVEVLASSCSGSLVLFLADVRSAFTAALPTTATTIKPPSITPARASTRR